jgi:hypothetical protein
MNGGNVKDMGSLPPLSRITMCVLSVMNLFEQKRENSGYIQPRDILLFVYGLD